MDISSRKGTAIVLCAPSGTGKTTLSKRLLARYERFAFSVSCTTRPPRLGEVNGKDYHFLSREEFLLRREQGYFAEWAEVHGNFYGTPLAAAQELLEAGRDLLFDIDVQGAAQLKQNLPDTYCIFLLPPSRAELERRLRSRGTETEEYIALRLYNSFKELKSAVWFDAWVINDNEEQAFEELCAAYRVACMHPLRRPNFLENLLREFS